MQITFKGNVFYWKGPAPFYFAAIPEKESSDIKAISELVTYGWGVIPAFIKVGDTELKTALFPKDKKYLVPLKKSLRKDELLEEGDEIEIQVEIRI